MKFISAWLLVTNGCLWVEQLADGVEAGEKRSGKNHQVFKLSFDARKCFDEKMIEQKLAYIHHNPVRGKWNLVNDFTEYKHSSARFYELDARGFINLVHYKVIGAA